MKAAHTHAPCDHKTTSAGEVYEYCETCGAVRHKREGVEGWHSCPACCLLCTH